MRTQPTIFPDRCRPVARVVPPVEETSAAPGARAVPRLRMPPPADAPPGVLDRSARAARPARPGKRVLIVEDDELTRDMLAAILAAEGYLVETAADGREALARLHGAAAPDLIVLDLLMPGMNGWEFRAAQAGDARLASIPVVVVSATETDFTQTAPALRPAAHLRKPITVEELLEVVGRC